MILTDDEYAEIADAVEDELIEDLIDGRLSDAEKLSFQRVLECSPELRNKVRLVRRLIERSNKAERSDLVAGKPTLSWFSFFSSPAFRFAALAGILILAGIAFWKIGLTGSDTDIALAELRNSVSEKRFSTGRTTLNDIYSPVLETRGQRNDRSAQALTKAKSLLLNEGLESPDNVNVRHSLGLMHMAESDLDAALAEMEKAGKLAEPSAGLLNDIGSVHLEKALASGDDEADAERTRSLSLALNNLERALAKEPARLDSLFNKALVLQKMGLKTQAKEAWDAYIAADPASKWTDEARKNLIVIEQESRSAIDPPTVLRDFREAFAKRDDKRAWQIVSETKELITGMAVFSQLSKELIEAAEKNDEKAMSASLDQMGYVGELEKRYSSDKFFFDLAAYYRKEIGRNQQALLTANKRKEAAYAELLAAKWGNALPAFEEVKSSYLKAGNRWEADLAEYQLCYILTQLDRINESSGRLNKLVTEAGKNGYRWTAVISNGWMGSNSALEGDHSAAIYFDERSLSDAKAISDVLNEQKAANQLTLLYQRLGNENKALEMIGRNSSLRPFYFQSYRQQTRNLLFGANALYRFGYLSAARAYAKEQLHVAKHILNDKWLTHTGHTLIAIIDAAAQDHKSAESNLEESFRVAESFDDPAMRERQTVETRRLLAGIQRESGKCQDAVNNYQAVIEKLERSEFSVSLYEAKKGKLLCHIQLNNDNDVPVEMASLIELFEKNRKLITAEADRNIFFDREQSVYDIAADHAYKRLGDSSLAFRYTESSRARSLLERFGPNTGDTVPQTLQQSMPKDVQMVYYAVLPERTIVWLIDGESVSTAEIAIGNAELTRRVRDYMRKLLDRTFSVEESNELYKLLIGPIAKHIKPGKAICFVPDKSLFMLSFASLANEGRFFVEDHPLLYAPSGAVFKHLTADASGSQISEERFGGIGATVFSRKDAPGLKDIDDALVEISSVSKLYPGGEMHTGNNATKKMFWDSFEKSDVFHFAGHYIVNRTDPEASRLLVADGSIAVSEIVKKGDLRTRLVVLSACESGVEGYFSGEGMIGGARAFLAAGVPVVIGSHWPMDSSAAVGFMNQFHTGRNKAKLNSPEALRQAQISMIWSSDQALREPYFWAAVMQVGGYADF